MADAKTKNADKGAASGDDQSMEEILQSIRKIIAEEGDEPAQQSPAEDGQEDATPPESDVLELTDAIQEDGSVMNVNDDVLNDIDDALDNAEAAAEPEPEPESEPEPAPEPEPKPKTVAAPAPKAPAKPAADEEGLVSSVSIAASAEAMRALKSSGDLGAMPFVSGETVEGLVMQLLRPLLKEWLDANLPNIVQQEVQREVKRITTSLEQDT